MAHLGYIKRFTIGKQMAKVKTIADKLSKVSENFSINMYDNGFMIEVSGQGYPNRDGDTEWATAKIIVPTVEELCELIKEVTKMTKD